MRKSLIIVFLLAVSLSCAAQNPGDVLARMNAIKLDPAFMWGTCALRDSAESRKEAYSDLVPHVNAFLKGAGYRFISDMSQCPDSLVQYLVYTKSDSYWRTLAYVEKSSLEQLERQQKEAFEAAGMQASLDALKVSLISATTLAEIQRLVEESGVADRVLSGELDRTTARKHRDGGYLIFYELSSGKIREILTPLDENGKRLDARTGLPTDSQAMPPARWLYFDEPRTTTR